MPRLISILLLAVFGLPLFTPLLAAGQSADAGLPACCRRNGAHHCGMSMGERDGLVTHDPGFSAPLEKCPYAPSLVAPAHPNLLAPPSTADAIFAALVSHPCGVAQTESRCRIARDRSRQKRGPPSLILL